MNGRGVSLQNNQIVLDLKPDGDTPVSSSQLLSQPQFLTVRYANGQKIPVFRSQNGQSGTDEIRFFSIGTISSTKFPKPTMIFFVGTETELDLFCKKLV
ncbi:unnamed protein product [Tuwongella immobilis]|uniref:Uncharacterized protein n=1 Tax=Tuwongella immobilis TaxID=692036 RepID=A0A6C2YSX2_9BACT|nr:unnamed protein product [Tuwongella immobilis]VTS06216.1 unnamed protein product [Tuwongella immobilis]